MVSLETYNILNNRKYERASFLNCWNAAVSWRLFWVLGKTNFGSKKIDLPHTKTDPHKTSLEQSKYPHLVLGTCIKLTFLQCRTILCSIFFILTTLKEKLSYYFKLCKISVVNSVTGKLFSCSAKYLWSGLWFAKNNFWQRLIVYIFSFLKSMVNILRNQNDQKSESGSWRRAS